MDNINAPCMARRCRHGGDRPQRGRFLRRWGTAATVTVAVCVWAAGLAAIGPEDNVYAASPAEHSPRLIQLEPPGTTAKIIYRDDYHRALQDLLGRKRPDRPVAAATPTAQPSKPLSPPAAPARPAANTGENDCSSLLANLLETQQEGGHADGADQPEALPEGVVAIEILANHPSTAGADLPSATHIEGAPETLAEGVSVALTESLPEVPAEGVSVALAESLPEAPAEGPPGALAWLIQIRPAAEPGAVIAIHDPQTLDPQPEPFEAMPDQGGNPLGEIPVVVLDSGEPPATAVAIREVAEPIAAPDQPAKVVEAFEEVPTPLVEDVLRAEDDERPIGSLTTDILPPLPGESEKVNLPSNKARGILAAKEKMPDYTLTRDEWFTSLYEWEASWLCHRPLYFEEVNLERYGYSRCPILQPVVSGARFFATVPILPYKMVAEPPGDGSYALGHYRPGSIAPYQFHWIPLRPKAGIAEAGVITGLIFAIP
jgi:hypothetical protein